MLARLSIRDIVLIERLDIDFGSGLAALTGETGAGKSILLDAFALALGARGDVALVREGAEQGQVIAVFDLAKKSLSIELSDDEIKSRLAKWKAPAPHYKTGVFAKYAALVSSASLGAITTAEL